MICRDARDSHPKLLRALLADKLEGELRNRAMSWFNGALHLGWLFGPLMAGITIGFLVLTAIVWIAFERNRFQGPPIGDVIAKRQAEIKAAEAAVGEAH